MRPRSSRLFSILFLCVDRIGSATQLRPRMVLRRVIVTRESHKRNCTDSQSAADTIGNKKHLLDSDDANDSDDDSDEQGPDSKGKFPTSNNTNNNNGSGSNNNSNNSNSNDPNNKGNSNDQQNSSGRISPGKDRGCVFINENDGRIQYTGEWTLEAIDPTGLTTTTHTTTKAGSQVSVTFDGTSIIVVGIVHPGNSSFPPPVASYAVDTNPPVELSLPFSTRHIPNQQFFQSPQLSPGEHVLLINVTSDGSPYTLDYLFFCGNATASVATASIPETASESTDLLPRKTAIIIGSILGACFLLLLIAFVYVLCSIRRRRVTAKRTTSPLREWLSRQTMFTSSDSIMRNNPSSSSTADPNDNRSPSTSGMKKSLPGPVIRTFSDFDRHYSFPPSIATFERDLPTTPVSGTRQPDNLTPRPPLPPKSPKELV